MSGTLLNTLHDYTVLILQKHYNVNPKRRHGDMEESQIVASKKDLVVEKGQ